MPTDKKPVLSPLQKRIRKRLYMRQWYEDNRANWNWYQREQTRKSHLWVDLAWDWKKKRPITEVAGA
jgi:hypothetical protein